MLLAPGDRCAGKPAYPKPPNRVPCGRSRRFAQHARRKKRVDPAPGATVDRKRPMNMKWAPSPPTQLRDDAEAEISGRGAHAPPAEALVHELQVHQIELEMQNEALRQTQVDLEESRDRYADLYEFAPVGYLILSRAARIVAINLTGAALLGEERGKLLQRGFAPFVAAADRAGWQQHFQEALRKSGKQTCELELQRSDGSRFAACLDCLSSTTDDTEGTLRVTLTDITERRRAVAELRQAKERLEHFAAEQAAHLRELAGELTRAEQRERDRLHELLHDEVQPLLVAARLSLSGLGPRSAQADCLRVAAEACTHIGQVIQVARALSRQLSPPLIREQGLNAALESLCRWVSNNHGLEVRLRSAPDTEPDDVALRLLCFSAVRELLMNVVKHANVARVTLTLRRVEGDTLCIVVADRGNGCDPARLADGSGLSGITRRLGMFGGALRIESRPGHGTVATLTAPLQAPSAEWGKGRRDRRARNGKNNAQDTDRG